MTSRSLVVKRLGHPRRWAAAAAMLAAAGAMALGFMAARLKLRAVRTVLALSTALLAGSAAAYDEGEAPPVAIPRLAATAASVEGFAPAGWSKVTKRGPTIDEIDDELMFGVAR